MSFIKNLDIISNWLKENVCKNIELKKPDDTNNSSNYSYQLVHPDTHIMYLPTKDILPINRHEIPSILVQSSGETIYPIEKKSTMIIKLGFSAWNPGLHTESGYTRNTEGYRDVFNFTEFTQRMLLTEEFIEHMRIKKEDGIEISPIKDNGIIADFYPYWFATMTFTVEYGNAVIRKNYNNLL